MEFTFSFREYKIGISSFLSSIFRNHILHAISRKYEITNVIKGIRRSSIHFDTRINVNAVSLGKSVGERG